MLKTWINNPDQKSSTVLNWLDGIDKEKVMLKIESYKIDKKKALNDYDYHFSYVTKIANDFGISSGQAQSFLRCFYFGWYGSEYERNEYLKRLDKKMEFIAAAGIEIFQKYLNGLFEKVPQLKKDEDINFLILKNMPEIELKIPDFLGKENLVNIETIKALKVFESEV